MCGFEGEAKPLDHDDVKAAIEKAQDDFANDGRILVRASGTEPVIRVMAEGDDEQKVEKITDDLCAVIENVAKSA